MATAEHSLVLGLRESGSFPIETVGGKAKNLGIMLHNGLPVPDGFVVTTSLYRETIRGTEVENFIRRLEETEEAKSLDHLCQKIRDTIGEAVLPEHAVSQIRLLLGDFPQDASFAVRSSATVEDLEDASFAGQQDTYLNVVGVDSILEAITACWASLWSFRAVCYRRSFGFTGPVALAVVVQKMIDSKNSGVMFTSDPTTGSRSLTLINASPGLGESIVSGSVTPDYILFDREANSLLKSEPGDRRLVVRSKSGGGTFESEEQTSPGLCIDQEDICKLVALGSELERLFGRPQDVEWAQASDGELFLTQSRAITTLYPIPAGTNPSRHDGRVFFCASYAWQGVHGPITPMGLSFLRIAAASVTELTGRRLQLSKGEPAFFSSIGERMFLEVGPALRNKLGRKAWLGFLGTVAPHAKESLNRLADRPEYQAKKGGRFKFSLIALKMFIRHGVLYRFFAGLIAPNASVRRAKRFFDSIKRRTEDSATRSAMENLEYAEKWVRDSIGEVWTRVVPFTGAGIALMGKARGLCQGEMLPLWEAAMRGISGNITVDMDLAIWDICEKSIEDPETISFLTDRSAADISERYLNGQLPIPLQEGVSNFLNRYGCRSVAEIDIGVTRWSEEPTPVFESILAFISAFRDGLHPSKNFQRLSSEADSAIETLASSYGVRGKAVAALLRRARVLYSCRELAKFYNVFIISRSRAQLQKVGKELAQLKRIDSPDDVFFLSLEELRDLLRGSSVPEVSQRRTVYLSESRRRYVPSLLLSDGSDVEALEALTHDRDATGADLSGTPASSGTVTAVVRVLFDPVGAELNSNEILVAPTTDPGWTPLFLTARGVILEVGGTASHGAVVAREYGIPAVVGVRGACSALRTGDLVTLDGSAGTIVIHSDDHSPTSG